MDRLHSDLEHIYNITIHNLFSLCFQDQASSLCGRAFSQLGAQAMLAAVPCSIYEKTFTKLLKLNSQ